MNADGIRRFVQVAREWVDDGRVPGLVALVACGDEVHAEALGSLTIGGPPVQRDSLFRIASTTKPITGATALALVGEGLLDLDEPVGRLLPELADPRVLRRVDGPIDDTVEALRPVTARQLLTFTFGFGMMTEMFTAAEDWPIVAAVNALPMSTFGPPTPAGQPAPDDWIAALATLPLMAQPGERWMYNTSAAVLGILISRAASASLGEVMRTRIFERLGMRDTAFWASDVSRLGTEYQPTPDGIVVWDTPDGQWSSPPLFDDGAAGLVSTADDLLAFARMLLRGGEPVLSGDAVAAMTTDQLTDEQKAVGGSGFNPGRSWGYCQSVWVEGPHAGAYGWDGGLGTSWYVDPAHDLVVIVLTQRMFESAAGTQLNLDMQAAAYEALGSA